MSMRGSTRYRRLAYLLAGTVAFAGLAVSARMWFSYYAPSTLVLAIGLPGPSPDVGTRCGTTWRHVGAVRVPTREVHCTRHNASFGQGRDEQHVTLDLLTRRVRSASRVWAQADSLAWGREHDSTRMAIRRRNGLPLQCMTPSFRSDAVRSVEQWRVGGHYERLIAYHWDAQNSLNEEWRREPWLVQMEASLVPPPGCQNGSAN
jgi:hypothetical protein